MTPDRRLFLGALLLFTAAKAVVVARLGPFGDELFYWQCSRHLDVAFADHPFMTALLVKLGCSLFGDTPFGIRSAFLAIGTILPFVVRATARRTAGPQWADRAGVVAIVLPATGHGGVLAIPDVPLLLFAALALYFAVRALESGRRVDFALAGAAAALALSTHVRGVLVVVGIGLALLATRPARRSLTTSGPWLALFVALFGLVPILLFNWRLDFAPLRYQGVERHSAGFQLEGLLEFLPLQAAIATPILFGYLLIALWCRARAARGGDAVAGLDAAFGLAHLGVFFLASPVMDTSHNSIHWPAAGYLALVPHVAPLIARSLASSRRVLRGLAHAALPGAAIVWSLGLAALAGLGGKSTEFARRPSTGWSDAAALVAEHLPSAPARPIVLADTYILAGALEFAFTDRADVFVLDHPKNHDHGRALQYVLWHRDEPALREHQGEPVLVVIEWNALSRSLRDRWQAHLEELVSGLEEVEERRVATLARRRTFTLYRGTIR